MSNESQFAVPEGMIDLSIGQPAFSLLPQAALKEAADIFFSGDSISFLQYGNPRGHYRFRERLAGFLSENYNFENSADNFCITAGASQALDMLSTVFASSGDTVYTEDPTYYLALDIFKEHGLKVEGIPLNNDGINLEILEHKLKKKVPAFLYIIPTYQNPTGTTYSDGVRKSLVRLCRKYGCILIADEVYQLLYFNEKPPLSFSSYKENEFVFTISSFSKIFTPGIRLGWIHGQAEKMKDFESNGLLFSAGGMNPVAQGIMNSALEQDLVEGQLKKLRDSYSERCNALSDGLLRIKDSRFRFKKPAGGFFIWAEIKDIDIGELKSAAVKLGVNFHNGRRFTASGDSVNHIRMSFCYYDSVFLAEGADRMGRLFGQFR